MYHTYDIFEIFDIIRRKDETEKKSDRDGQR
jgi:hypothetical protein